MTDMVRAKVYVREVAQQGYGGKPTPQQKITFAFVSGNDELSENHRFHKYTPSGELSMLVDNPAIDGFFTPGREFYVDFTPAPVAED